MCPGFIGFTKGVFMARFFLCICFLLFVLPAHAEGTIGDRLEETYRRYQAALGKPDEERLKVLIELDQSLRLLINKPWTSKNRSIDNKYWKEKYQTIGVFVGHYSDALGYEGKLLRDAKALDVDLKYGAYTRYANICDGAGSFSGCDMPNIKAAFEYETDFPTGPFIEDVLVTIGNFYDDLFKALKSKETKDYKYDCFSKYMSDKPLTAQIENARKLAIKYYTKVLALRSDNIAANKSIEKWKGNLESGESEGWHFCGD